MKSALFTLAFSIVFTGLYAQSLSFDKKSGAFKAGDKVVAKLTDEKVKEISRKNYHITDATGQTKLMSFLASKFQDTLGGTPEYYVTIHSNAKGLRVFTPEAAIGTYKELGEMIVSKNLLQENGELNDANVKSWFEKIWEANGDLPKKFEVLNDSMAQLLGRTPEPVERDRRKPIIANEFGKIGQGNVVIGHWEFIEEPKKGDAFGGKTYHFVIKNLEGGIACVSWIELSGAHSYAYRNGMRSNENWSVPDFINHNPITYKLDYVVFLSQQLAAMGLL